MQLHQKYDDLVILYNFVTKLVGEICGSIIFIENNSKMLLLSSMSNPSLSLFDATKKPTMIHLHWFYCMKL